MKLLIAGVDNGSPGQQTSSRGFTWVLLSSVKREDPTKSEVQLRVSSQRSNTDSLCCETQKNKVSSSETDDRLSQNTKRERCLFGRDDKQHTARLETGWIMIKSRIKFPVLTNLKQQLLCVSPRKNIIIKPEKYSCLSLWPSHMHPNLNINPVWTFTPSFQMPTWW